MSMSMTRTITRAWLADAALHLTLPYLMCPLIGPYKVATHLAVKHTKYLHSDTEKSLARKDVATVPVNCAAQLSTVNPTPQP